MNIDILCIKGSPTGVTPLEIDEKGVGGAELALLRLAEGLAERGHYMRVYNDPRELYQTKNLLFLPRSTYRPEDKRNILITFRGPNELSRSSNFDQHIGFSCDQFTEGNYNEWYSDVNKMVVISEFHRNDHIRRYPGFNPSKTIISDLGVLEREYMQMPAIKEEKSFIFCSVPDRGLGKVAALWPRIIAEIPDAKLIITSDYRLWGVKDPGNMQYRLNFIGQPGVKFLGKVTRSELVKFQLASEIHLYPCTYDENFCISAAETQAAGCLALTTNIGALGTTNFTGKQLFTDDDFIKQSVEFLSKPIEERLQIHETIQRDAITRFSWEKILDHWEKNILA